LESLSLYNNNNNASDLQPLSGLLKLKDYLITRLLMLEA